MFAAKRKMKMKNMPQSVFLFGAGASYGSDDIQKTPPVGSKLFDALCAFDPSGWGSIPSNLTMSFRTNFEDGMKLVNPHALGPLQRAMAAYFFEFVPSLSNLYYKLALRVADSPGWSGAACTLNYERLLELSLGYVGIEATPSREATFEICLPHGCCHLFCDSVKARSDSVSFNGFCAQTNGPISVIRDAQQHRNRLCNEAIPPVMSYFEPSKYTTAGHSFIQEQRARWRVLATYATTIVVVGVRVRPHDDHIWGPIAESDARIVYCGGPGGASEYENWANQARPSKSDRVLTKYFQEEFQTICSEIGL